MKKSEIPIARSMARGQFCPGMSFILSSQGCTPPAARSRLSRCAVVVLLGIGDEGFGLGVGAEIEPAIPLRAESPKSFDFHDFALIKAPTHHTCDIFATGK
jgi:hypothetical protein